MEGEEGSMERLAHLVYLKGKRQYYKKYYEDKYKSRIEFLVGCNNELMAELEQWERVGKRLEKATETDTPLSPEEEQIVRMPWLKEHIIKGE